MKRRILIMGQGNIGTFLGAALQQCANNEVYHFVRNKQEKPKSIVLNFTDRRKTKNKIPKNSRYNYLQTDDHTKLADFDFIFLPLRHTQWKAVIEDTRGYLQPTQTVILCGNILNDFTFFEQQLPCPYVYAFPNFGGAIIEGKLQGWLTAKFTIGTTNSQFNKQLYELKYVLEEVGFCPKTEPDVKGWLMTHFAYNAGMLAEAARHGGFQKIAKSFSGLAKMYLLMRKCVNTIGQLGIDINKYSDAKAVYQPIWWNVFKTYLVFLIPGMAKSADATKDTEEWLSYLKSIQQLADENRINIPN